jgi:hypothetical protein
VASIVTVKWGDKYSAEDVNALYNHKYPFFCYTDDPKGLHPNIQVIPIEDDLEVWWNKLSMFKRDFGGIKGKIIYFDLDVVIQNDIETLLAYDTFTLIKCYWKPYKELHTTGIRHDMNINSSVMVWNANENVHIWEHFNSDPEWFMLNYRGIDGFMFHEDLEAEFFKENLIYSRLYGINADSWYNPQEAYCLKDAVVCLMNGQTVKEDYKRLKLDLQS